MPPRTEQQKAERKRLRNERRDAWFADKTCADCGKTTDLQVDHIDPLTKFPTLRNGNSNAIWEWNDIRRTAELAKCQALCGDCHRTKTGGEWRQGMYPLPRELPLPALPKGRKARGPVTKHGADRYETGCRCGVCLRGHERREGYFRRLASDGTLCEKGRHDAESNVVANKHGVTKCRACQKDTVVAYRERLRKQLEDGSFDKHGEFGYQIGCRCDVCKAGLSAAQKRRRLARKASASNPVMTLERLRCFEPAPLLTKPEGTLRSSAFHLPSS